MATVYRNLLIVFYHLQDELVRTKSGEHATSETGYFNAQIARASLHTLRVSLNRSIILPPIEVEAEDEMDVDEDDVHELRDQISKIHSSSEDTLDDFMDAESGEDSPRLEGNPRPWEHDDQVVIDDSEGPLQEEPQKMQSNTNADHDQVSDRKSVLSISASEQLSPIQDAMFCSSPKIHKARKSIASPGFSPSKLSESSPGEADFETYRKSAVRSSLQSSKLSPTDSLAASLQRGLHIIEYHQQNPPAPRKSFVGLSFDHFALNPRQSAKASSALQALPEGDASSASTICSSCKKAMDTNDDHSEDINSEKQIVTATAVTSNDLANASLQVCYFVGMICTSHILTPAYTFVLYQDGNITSTTGSKRVAELEALCEEQAAKIKELSNLVCCACKFLRVLRNSDNYFHPLTIFSAKLQIGQQKKGSEDGERTAEDKTAEQCEDSKMPLDVNEREALEGEIQRLKDQVKLLTDGSTTNDSLLDQIRNGSTDQEYELEKERQKWMESESKWISLTEELRMDLESNRKHAEKTEAELRDEKKCTEELDDALQRAIYGHARIIEHYVELQELYNDLLERHRGVMGGIAEVKRAAARAGKKGCGTAFAAALAAELSTVRIDREKERAQLREQNRRLRVQLRDTAEAVHAAGELLVRLREAEEASTQEKVGRFKLQSTKSRT